MIERFGWFLFCAMLHELGHVVAAKLVGVSTQTIRLTLLGPIAYMPRFDDLSETKRMLVLLAGPAVSLVLFFGWKNQGFLGDINLLLAVFNLLPIRPLDGGELFFMTTRKWVGTVNANHLLKKSADVCVALIFFVGLVQVYLYPFNVSLILLAVYLKKRAQQCYHQTYHQLFRILSQRL